jgi:putative alpha-1,2-mannosidase
VRLNGRALTRSWVREAELDGPCLLEFTMSETPTAWARDAELAPSLP